MLVGNVQNDSITLRHTDVKLVAVLLLCAVVLVMFFGFAAKAVAAPEADTSIHYDDASCSICHYANVQLEHEIYGGCTACHDNTQYPNFTDYAAPDKKVDIAGAEGKKACGVNNPACHGEDAKYPWHGNPGTAQDAMNAAHAVSKTTLPAPLMWGDNDGCDGSLCHGSNTYASKFTFAALDIAAAHTDYNHAVLNDLTSQDATPQVSPAITASVSACGLCHDKAARSALNHSELKPAIADKIAESDSPVSCLTCHVPSAGSYVTNGAYPDFFFLQYYMYGGPFCYKADPSLTATDTGAAPTAVSLTSALAKSPATSPETTAPTTGTQLDALISQLSPDLQAQLSGVAGPQEQLSAGTLPADGSGIPASALPATSISHLKLF